MEAAMTDVSPQPVRGSAEKVGVRTARVARVLTRPWTDRGGPGKAATDERQVLVLAAFAPILLDLALRLVDLGSSWRGLVWMVMGASFISLLLLSPGWADDRLGEQRRPLEWMLSADGVDGAHDLHSPASAYFRDAQQQLPVGRSHHALCLLGGAAAFAGNYYASTQLPAHTIGPIFWLYAFAAGYLATDVFRWALRLPRIFIKPLVREPRLRIVAHAPASTPAIRDMAQLATDIALRANAGLFLVGLGLLWEVLSARGYNGHGVSHVERLALVDLGPLMFTAVVAVYLSFVPQHWLSQIALRQRNRIADQLAPFLSHDDPSDLLSDHTQQASRVFDNLLASPTATTEARVFARRVLAVIVVVLPQAVAVALKVAHLG